MNAKEFRVQISKSPRGRGVGVTCDFIIMLNILKSIENKWNLSVHKYLCIEDQIELNHKRINLF